MKDPRYANKKLSRTASSTSTINTFTTLSSNNSDTMDSESRVCNTSNNNTNNSMPPVTPLTDVSSTPNSNANSNGSVLLAPSKKPDTIKVSLEIPHRGYLRGELIPIKLNINHLRKIQDLSGIIITFVRVCRIDNGPETLFDSFRKDLQQLVIPLFVDPNTFQSEINTSVRVPADSFPTISGCPLVSFQYFIEVLINLSGKSLSIDQESKTGSNGNDLIIGAATSAAASSPFNFNYQPHGSFDSKERSTYINTDKYKRMKKFLQLTTEVIIGTHRLKQSDSTGAYNNNNQNQNTIITEGSGESSSPISRRSSLVSGSNIPAVFHVDSPRDEIHDVNLAQPLNQPGLPLGIPSPHPPQFADDGMVPSYDNSPSTSEALIPLPQLPDLSEKEQMRLREVSLLPSAPPLDDIEEDLDGVSPINGDEDILQQINERVHENINVNDHEFDENDQQEYDTLNGDADDSNDQYSEIDFVPNYESVHNDRLVTFERENRNNSSPNVTNEA